jgi:hypothetical protein
MYHSVLEIFIQHLQLGGAFVFISAASFINRCDARGPSIDSRLTSGGRRELTTSDDVVALSDVGRIVVVLLTYLHINTSINDT